MSKLELGVVASARKPGERRLPIHPGHFERIPREIRSRIHFEHGYGEAFGVSDQTIAEMFGSVRPREEITQQDIVLLPKPLARDLQELRPGAIHWGWPHCVQQRDITDVAIERKLTLLAWEAMFTWKGDVREHHLFYKNNEMAGYCAVIHGFELTGDDGLYGPPKKSVVLSFGSVSRGAIYALLGRGCSDITIYTKRPAWSVRDQIPECAYGQMIARPSGEVTTIEPNGQERPLLSVLQDADVIVNGILQDTDAPMMYMKEGDEDRLRRGSLIVDVSCDLGMGFPFARPTSFADPMFTRGEARYYAVDHTPSYLWRAATWEISTVICEYLPKVMQGPEAWKDEPALMKAVEIEQGEIKNEKIRTFQGR